VTGETVTGTGPGTGGGPEHEPDRPGVDIALVVCPPMTPGLELAVPGDWAAQPGWASVITIDRWESVTADVVLFMPSDCRLAPDTHSVLHELFVHNPRVDLVYFDSAEQTMAGAEARHRPGYSPERLRAQQYLGPVFATSRSLAEMVDPTAPLDHADALELASRARSVAHVPRIQYSTPLAAGSGDHGRSGRSSGTLAADGHQARLDAERFPASARPRQLESGETVVELMPALDDHPKVSIVMPTNGASRDIDGRPTELCTQAIDTIVGSSTYPDYEIVVVVTPGAPDDLVGRIADTVNRHPQHRRPFVRFCHDNRPFNFSNACNRGAVAASGSVLVFCNDDTVVDTASWLERLVMYATRPDIGAVGARLHYGDGTIQHAGIWTRGGHPTHRYERFAGDHPGYLDSLAVPQNCLAVSGACLAVQAEKFRAVGGFCPRFPSSYNDVDLCLKLADAGWRTVLDPGTVLTHYEASSRDPGIDEWEMALLHERWRSVLIADPYDNPNHLAPGSDEFPPPDATVTTQRQRAGLIDHPPRIIPLPRLTIGVADRTIPALGPGRTETTEIDLNVDQAPADEPDRPLAKVLPWAR
jgi:GT2 family glycosyltransferase